MRKLIVICLLAIFAVPTFAAENPFLKLESRVVNHFEDQNLNRIFNMSFGELPIEMMKGFNIEWDKWEEKEDIELKEVSSASIFIYSRETDYKLNFPKGLLSRFKKDGWQILDEDEGDESRTVLLRQRFKSENTYLACLILTPEKLILLEVVGKEDH